MRWNEHRPFLVATMSWSISLKEVRITYLLISRSSSKERYCDRPTGSLKLGTQEAPCITPTMSREIQYSDSSILFMARPSHSLLACSGFCEETIRARFDSQDLLPVQGDDLRRCWHVHFAGTSLPRKEKPVDKLQARCTSKHERKHEDQYSLLER